MSGTAPPVTADPELLRIVFHNLFLNAAHAMQGQGSIRVTLGATDRTVGVAIVDTGPGIPPDILEKIFTPFFTTKARGSGLGLPTAKRLVEAQQGRISVDCPADGGTAVRIEIPLVHG